MKRRIDDASLLASARLLVTSTGRDGGGKCLGYFDTGVRAPTLVAQVPALIDIMVGVRLSHQLCLCPSIMQADFLRTDVDDLWTSDWVTSNDNFGESGLFDDVACAGDCAPPPGALYGYTSSECGPAWDTPMATEPEPEPQTTSLSYSTVFNDQFVDADGNTPNFELVASDGVHFCVSASRLHSASSNNFAGRLQFPSATIPLSSCVLNIVLHGVYNLSLAMFAPSLHDLSKLYLNPRRPFA